MVDMGMMQATGLMARVVKTFGILTAVLLASWASASDTAIVVRYRGEPGEAGAQRFAVTRGLRVQKRLQLPNVVVIDAGKQHRQVLNRLQNDPEVIYAEPDRVLRLADTIPNDPLFPQQWALRNTGQTSGTPAADIHAAAAWDITTGSTSAVIAIVDTGLDMAHPEFAGRLWTNPGEVPGNGIDDDLNGFIDDVHGWNFFNNSNDPSPTQPHGTKVAGLAAASGNNAVGIAGITWASPVMALTCFDSTGNGPESAIVDAVVYAIDNGAKVVNASWGDTIYSHLLEDMAIYARDHGVLICAAAGNFNYDADAHPFYPACLPYDSIISIGGTDHTDGFVYNYAVANVDVVAPALSLLSTDPGGGYSFGSGTSYAAPHVVGVAALVAGLTPGLPPRQLKHRLMGTVDRKDALDERSASGGRLSALGAVAVTDTTPPGAPAGLQVEHAAPNGAVLRFVAPGDDGASGQAAFCDVRVSTQPINAAAFDKLPFVRPFMRPGSSGNVQRILLNELEPGPALHAALRIIDKAGNAGPLSPSVEVNVPAPVSIFADSCDTTSAFWMADGFALAQGSAHTGTMSWQDSPGGNYAGGTSTTLTGGPLDLRGLAKPRLQFYLQYSFPSRVDQLDRFEVQISADAGATWRVMRKYHATCSPVRRQIVPLDSFAGLSDVRVRFLVNGGQDTTITDDGVYIDDIAVYDAGDPVPEFREHIIENMDFFALRNGPPEFQEFPSAGAWTYEFGYKSRAPRVDSYHTVWCVPGAAGAKAVYTPMITTEGLYDVYATWGTRATATGVKYEVAHKFGTYTVVLDQAGAADRWVQLGRFWFGYGQDPARGSVALDASSASGTRAYSDAIRFRLASLDSASADATGWSGYE